MQIGRDPKIIQCIILGLKDIHCALLDVVAINIHFRPIRPVIVLTNLNKKFIVFDILVPVLIEKISDILESLNLLNTDKLHPHVCCQE